MIAMRGGVAEHLLRRQDVGAGVALLVRHLDHGAADHAGLDEGEGLRVRVVADDA